MDKSQWKTVIESQIKIELDYISSFQTVIMILSEILEERDHVYNEYVKQGANPVINHTLDRGAVNMKPNPLLRQWNELNTTALAYMRDLGITPAGLRKLQGTLPKQKTSGGGFSKLEENEDNENIVNWSEYTRQNIETRKKGGKHER